MDNIIKDYTEMNVDSMQESLSSQELDDQLLNNEDVLRRGPTGFDEGGSFKLNVNDAVANAFRQAEALSQRQELVDHAVKAAAHGVKILAPIMEAVSAHGGSPEEGSRIMSSILMRTNSDTKTIIEAYGLKEGEAPAWLSATVSGMLIKIITNALKNGNTAILDKPSNDYIQPLIDHAKEASQLGLSGHPSANPDLEIANSLMMATCAVMAEYQCFSYFHKDTAKIANQVATYFNDRVIRGTLDDLTERFTLSPSERSYFANSLLKSAGSMMAQQWANGVADTIAEVKALPAEARRAVAVSGYPLSNIIERFEGLYQGIELSCENAIRVVSPDREVLNQNLSQTHGPNVG